MSRLTLCLLYFCAASLTVSAQQSKELAAGKELRSKCHAHFYYTAALHEESDESRMALLTKAIELDPTLARAFYNRGNIYARRDQLALAKADFQKAVELKGDYIHAHYNLACILSLESHFDDALTSLEKALANGYQKFDKIPGDSDFKGLKDNPAFGKLIAKYQASNDPKKLSAMQKMQTSDVEERARLLVDALRNSDPQAMQLALWAIHEPDYQLRVLGFSLLRKLNRAESKFLLACGLYDGNGYVNKASGNALITYGKDVEGLMTWVLEDKGTPAPFYARQVLAKIRAPSAAEKMIRPLLRNDDPMTRIMAAESLANLKAVAALPEMEAALKDLPKDEKQHGFYKAALGRAIEHLREIEKAGNK